MKKIITLLFAVVYFVLISTNNVYAQEYLKNFYAYEVQNINVRELSTIINNAIAAYDKPSEIAQPLKDVKYAYLYSDANSTYFIKLYPANKNTNIFVVSNEEYNVKDNDITDILKAKNRKYTELKDKAALKEYKFDFYVLARQKKLGNFYISPDLVKPLKVGVSKLNEKLFKNSKKSAMRPYNNDKAAINLTCVDSSNYYDEAAKISISQREYRLKEKANNYVHAFEYIITNNNDVTTTISVTSEKYASMKDVSLETFSDWDRIDLMDQVGSFPVTVICTCGLSLALSVPNWVRYVKITKELGRYTYALPENYQLKPQSSMRILVLKYKNDPKALHFSFKFPDETYNIAF